MKKMNVTRMILAIMISAFVFSACNNETEPEPPTKPKPDSTQAQTDLNK